VVPVCVKLELKHSWMDEGFTSFGRFWTLTMLIEKVENPFSGGYSDFSM
jgi:hypothetical protein